MIEESSRRVLQPGILVAVTEGNHKYSGSRMLLVKMTEDARREKHPSRQILLVEVIAEARGHSAQRVSRYSGS
jgi:hypothetical protein